MLDLKVLHKIQQLYMEEEVTVRQLKKLPQKGKLKRFKEEIELGQNQLAERKKVYNKLAHRQKEMEFNVETVKEKQKVISARLYSGEINNVKELETVNGQLEQYNQEINEMENELISLMEEKEKLHNNLKKQNDELNVIKNEFRIIYAEYQNQKGVLTDRLSIIPGEIEKASKKVDKNLLSIYNSLRDEFNFEVIVKVENSICSGCHMGISFDQQNKLKDNNELIYCDHCGRILLFD